MDAYLCRKRSMNGGSRAIGHYAFGCLLFLPLPPFGIWMNLTCIDKDWLIVFHYNGLKNVSYDYYYHTFDIKQKEHQLKDLQPAFWRGMRRIHHHFAFAFHLVSIHQVLLVSLSHIPLPILTVTGSLALGDNVLVDTEIMSWSSI